MRVSPVMSWPFGDSTARCSHQLVERVLLATVRMLRIVVDVSQVKAESRVDPLGICRLGYRACLC